MASGLGVHQTRVSRVELGGETERWRLEAYARRFGWYDLETRMAGAPEGTERPARLSREDWAEAQRLGARRARGGGGGAAGGAAARSAGRGSTLALGSCAAQARLS